MPSCAPCQLGSGLRHWSCACGSGCANWSLAPRRARLCRMPEVVPCRGPLGARIEGLDRSRAGEPETATLLNRALAEHLLVVVPGERMTPLQTLAFAKAFGTPRTQLLRYKHRGDEQEVSDMVSPLMADGTTDTTAIRAKVCLTVDLCLG